MQRSNEALAAPAMGQYPVSRWLAGQAQNTSADWVAEEVPVALVYNGLAHAVMLCSPQDLDDFARGFSLSEGIVDRLDEIYDLEVCEQPDGIQISLTIAQARFWALKAQRRHLAGRTGCGLCGKESLAQLTSTCPPVGEGSSITVSALQRGLDQLKARQPLFSKTGSAHAAAWCDPQGNLLCLREDVGRHNALDKLIGHGLSRGLSPREGLIILTSRASYEMVHKAAACGITLLAAMSGPTGLAVRQAQALGVTLIGFARDARCSVYTHPQRIL